MLLGRQCHRMRNISFFTPFRIPYPITPHSIASVSRTMSSMQDNQTAPEAPWHAAYPAPKSEAVGIFQSDLLAMLEDGKEPGKDYILVDLRRNDHAVRWTQADRLSGSDISLQGGTIAGSINLPAQNLYPSIPTLYTLIKAAGVSQVIWHCGKSLAHLPENNYNSADRLQALPRGAGIVPLHGLQIMWPSRNMETDPSRVLL